MSLFLRKVVAAALLMSFIAACNRTTDTTVHAATSARESTPTTTSTVSPSPPAPPIVELSLDEAFESAAEELFVGYQPSAVGEKRVIVISPLVQDKAGNQNTTTRQVQSSIDNVIRTKYPKFEILPFTVSHLAEKPLVLIGTLAAIDKESGEKVGGKTYRLLLNLADLTSEKIVAKGRGYVKREDIDLTPTAHFKDAILIPCPVTDGYISTCQESKIGDTINRVYFEKNRCGTNN